MPPGTTTYACACCDSGNHGTNCAGSTQCYKRYDIDYDCDTDTFGGGGGWTVTGPFCYSATTSTALQSESNGDPDFPCRLFKYVAANGTGTCCLSSADCSGAVFTAPAIPTNPQAAGCCCCACPDCSANGCSTTFTITVSGSPGLYGGSPPGCDGTFTVKACQPNPAGTPCGSTLADCQWYLLLDSGDINNDITLHCEASGDWVINACGCQFRRKRCCPASACPATGTYTNVSGGSCNWVVTLS